MTQEDEISLLTVIPPPLLGKRTTDGQGLLLLQIDEGQTETEMPLRKDEVHSSLTLKKFDT